MTVERRGACAGREGAAPQPVRSESDPYGKEHMGSPAQ